ncbi:unnamed protein product [Ilex paraguariensis]|uniref:DUF641 domain-containing protein n=1 Tax=Ilex paraguariensis TaxID=185542 RepID=A0ABC8S919_9AQUA
MDSIKPSSTPTKSRLAKTFQKVISLKTSTKSLSNNGFCLIIPQEKLKCCDPSQQFEKEDTDEASFKNRAAIEAFIAKLFATISAVEASYAELQIAQFPYNVDHVQSADQAVVNELKALSELKYSFLKKKIDSSPPHVTLLLAEIQEQQSLMKTYEITMKKMESEIEVKDSEISSLKEELNDTTLNNKSLEKKLNESGCFSVLDNVNPSNSDPKDFNMVLNYVLRSVRNFVKLLIREMESANWDIEAASKAIEPEVTFKNTDHKCFAFESFVCREMFDGFNIPTFSLLIESLQDDNQGRFFFFDQFKKLKSVGSIQFLKENEDSLFGKFLKTKYLRLTHPKMETSFSGNLNQRKMINSSEYPETEFFKVFAEMARRVWILHCLAFSFDQQLGIFQVRKGSRFSEVFMESVDNDVFAAADGGFVVAFTVVPGFRVGNMVIQSRVYLSPAVNPVNDLCF